MEQVKFKTNINCGGCVAKVTPFLDKEESIEKWNVDTTNAEKTLTVEGGQVDIAQVEEAVKKAGFKIERK